MDSARKLRVLSRIWGANRDGYVFLPWINGSADTKEKRRNSFHEGRAFKWPDDKAAIREHIDNHTEDDLYFTPAIFNGKRRVEHNVDAERTLWADLDPVDPESLGDLRPTIAWETSPGRYQAIWMLNTEKVGASWPSQENHRLSLYIGADPSGWDSTQLLRVPGCINHKPEYGGGAPGKLLWDNGPRYQWDDFDDLPEVGIVTDTDSLLDEDLLKSMDRHEVWARVRMSVSSRVREAVSLKTQPVGADRSAMMWEIERELADAGCSLAEIVLLVRSTVWNKYRGRSDELNRLKTEAAKALANKPDDDTVTLEEPAKPDQAIWLNDLMEHPIPRPKWLVNNVWTDSGCGFISGAPKSYKSWMALDLAVSVATGSPFLGIDEYVTRQAPVLYLQEEDDLRLVMDRMAMVLEERSPHHYWGGQIALETPRTSTPDDDTRAPLTDAHRLFWLPPADRVPLAVHVQTSFIASDPSWQAWLADMCSTFNFGLIVIDTLGTTAGDIDTDRSGEVMSKMLKPLKQLAQTHKVAIAIVHHNKKEQTGHRAGQMMLGSTALHAWVDCALYARSKENNIVVLEREAKLAMDVTLRLRIPQMFANTQTGDRQLWAPEIDVSNIDPPTTPATEGKGLKKRRQRIPYKLASLIGHHPCPWDRIELNGFTRDIVEHWAALGAFIIDPAGVTRGAAFNEYR